MLLIIDVIVNAFGRRFGGGLLGQWFGDIGGTQVARAVQSILLGVTVGLHAPQWWMPLAAAALCFVGTTAGFPTGMVPRSLKDVLGLVGHGLMAVGPLMIGAALVGLPWLPLLLAAVARGPIYWAAPKLTFNFPSLGLLKVDPPPLAEFMSGAALGAAIYFTFA